ncbi:MAG: diaminopimelate epimerase [bacterium]|nr:diaminopimelate epimerase [bacterium]
MRLIMHTPDHRSLRSLPFEKWHGTGNDFILCSESVTGQFMKDIATLAQKMCARHFGIGSDGLILVGKSDKADFKMRMWNPDGSESEMCGNGMRCVGAHLKSHNLVNISSTVKIETLKRIIGLNFIDPPDFSNDRSPWIRLDMGVPVVNRRDIPISGDGNSPVINESLVIPGLSVELKFTGVNFGNPHAVIFMNDVPGISMVDEIPLSEWGPLIENYVGKFPNRINVEFVEVIAPGHVKMRVWERGAGITLSCGSGVAAIQAACHLTGNASDRLRVDVPGGSLITEYSDSGHVYLTGPATQVFSGEWLE